MKLIPNEGGIVTRLDLKRRDRQQGECAHSNMTVWENDRSVTCDDCHASLDPWRVLMEYARSDRSLYWTEEAMKRVREEHATLTQHVRRLQAQVSRLRSSAKKLGEEPVVHAYAGGTCRCWQCVPLEIAVTPNARAILLALPPEQQAELVSRLVLADKGA